MKTRKTLNLIVSKLGFNSLLMYNKPSIKEYLKMSSNLKIILLFAIFCLVSTFAEAQSSCNSCRTTSDRYGRCRANYTPDIPLTTATQEQLDEINQIYNRLSHRILGKTEPNNLQTSLNTAISNYNGLEISVTDGNISGNIDITGGIRDPSKILKYFAQYIKFRPTASDVEDIKQKASNLVWLILKKNCDGSLPIVSFFNYREFMKPVTFLLDYISDDSKMSFYNLLYNFNGLGAFYRSNYTTGDGIFSADMMRSSGISLTGYVKFLNDDNEKVRWMKGITRLMNRSFTYSRGGNGGIKPDGSGFHHLFSYPAYMGSSYNTSIDIIVSLDETSFQISKDSYLRFRDAIYYQRIIGNDAGMKAFSMSGRFPNAKGIQGASIQAIGDLAIIGGKILGLETADPVLAGYYNRIKGGTNPEFNYTKVAPFEEGYIQFNHTEGGVYRKDDYLVFFKGFSSSTFGIEAFEGNNLFGRYQSYGAMEIIVPGYTGAKENGFHTGTWNWNYNPGTTTIVLPWKKLEKRQSYGSQQKRFVGSLSLKNKGKPMLTKVFGTYGLFAMDFQEASNKNPTFIFKKSNFTFSDMIVCLGSDINNNNTRNNTVTTLYQRLANSRNVTANGTVVTAGGSQTFTGSNNWVISNANNGFYVVNGGDIKIWSGSSPTGSHQSDPGNITLTTDFKPNTYGYIDHGTSPSNEGYEYICTPKTTVRKMTALHTKMQDSNNLPYIVHQKNANAHIVEHKKDKIWGYSLFSTNSNINHTGSIIKGNDKPCLVMYQKTDENNILLSVTNPDLGFDVSWTNNGVVRPIDMRLILNGQWLLSSPNPSVKLVSSNVSETILEFNLVDGLPVEVQVVKANKGLAANAGNDQIVAGGVVVTLDGSLSFDPENKDLTYSWTQTSGTPTVTLSDTTVAMPTFTAPQLMANTKLVFSLTVTDSKGTVSPADTVTITINRSLDNFITTWTVTDSDKSITFPGTGSYTINWGDESTVESATENISHTYANAGTYTVTASNEITRFNLNNGMSKSKLTSIEQWGTAQWTNMFTAFRGASNMVYNATDTPNLSSVTNMEQMFRGASLFNPNAAHSINSWNVSNVQFMNLVFAGAATFNGDISGWNVSKVTRMVEMFSGARAFNGDISSWNVSKVANMSQMFHNTPAFIQNIGSWFITPDTFTVDGGIALGSVVGTITTQGGSLTDPTITYTISGGTDREKFSLTSTGTLTINESPSFLTQPSYSIEVTADGSFGRWGFNFIRTRIVDITVALPPIVTITSSSGDSGTGTTSTTLNYAATFSEAVTGFDRTDITVTGTANNDNPVASNFVAVTGDTTYTFDVVKGLSDGTVSVSIASGVATGINSNLNSVSSNIYELTIATIPVLNTPSVLPYYNPTEELSVQFNAYGISPLIFSLTGDVPQGITIDKTFGLLTWTPTESQVGTHSVTITVSNSLGEDSETIIITVGIDTDSDGVFDNIDTCPNTPSGGDVNAVGCIQLSSNNFEISSTTPKCPGVNNGKISIKNLSPYMFNFVVTGPDSYNNTFENISGSEPFVIEDLAVGTYNIIAKFSTTGTGQDITGFQTIISSATPVSGTNKSIDTIGKSSVFTVSGDKKYSIFINDVFQRSETFSDEGQYEITVNNLSIGENHIEIIPENKCRGLIEEWIIIPNSNVKFYPNPAVDLFHIGGLESSDITVQIFAYNGQRVYSKNHKSVNGIVYFSIGDLPAGLYIIRVFGKRAGDNITFKIAKK